MKIKEVEKNDNIAISTHFFGDVAVNEKLCEYTFPGVAAFFCQINLAEHNMLGHTEGMIYIFLDLSGYYSEEYGEYALLPIVYYTKDKITDILDDFNESHDLDYINKSFILEDGEGVEMEKDRLIITDNYLLNFFSNFDNDLKKVEIVLDKIKENTFNEGIFKIFK